MPPFGSEANSAKVSPHGTDATCTPGVVRPPDTAAEGPQVILMTPPNKTSAVRRSGCNHLRRACKISGLSVSYHKSQNHEMIYGYARVSTEGQSVTGDRAKLSSGYAATGPPRGVNRGRKPRCQWRNASSRVPSVCRRD